MELSHRQMLLLNEYVYLDGSTNKGITILENIYDKFKNENGNYIITEDMLSGGLNVEEAIDILKEIENNEVLRNLKVADSIDTGVRGCCFVDSRNPASDNAILVYRGTGGIPLAWKDNFKSMYIVETIMQQEAYMFAQEVMENYHIELVTGHSKGGNFAQLVTVLADGKIDECVSFDGQGFSDAFVELHNKEINDNKFRITSISSNNDFVNVLFNCIAERNIYIDTDTAILKSHNTSALKKLHLFNKDGNYRAEVMCMCSKIPSSIHELSLKLYKKRANKVADFLGSLCARCLGNKSIEDQFEILNKFYISKGLENKPLVKKDGKYVKEPNDFEILEKAIVLSEIKQNIESIGKLAQNNNYNIEYSKYINEAYKGLVLEANNYINEIKILNEEGKLGVNIGKIKNEVAKVIIEAQNNITEYEKSGKMSLRTESDIMQNSYEENIRYQNCESIREAGHRAYIEYNEQRNQPSIHVERNDTIKGER